MVFTPERIAATFVCALIYAVIWKYGNREARESTAPGAVLNWALALVFAVLLAGGLVYAQASADNTYQPPCELYWILGWPWCWPF